VAQHPVVLTIQDTSEIDFTGKQVAAELGPLTSKHCRGLFLHPTLAVTPEKVCLGVVAAELRIRPEETAPVVRAALENNLIQRDQLLKLYYIGPMFRYERPQAGRYRQFYQAGVEAFGSADPTLDAEIVIMAWQIFEKLGLLDLEVDINSVGDEKCRPQYVEKLKAYFKDQEKALCEDCRVRLHHNELPSHLRRVLF
jgi:hypothetical protein